MAGSNGANTIYDDVTDFLARGGSNQLALALWGEIHQAFNDSGPEAVKALMERRVRELKTAANKDLKASRDVAREIGPPKRKAASRAATPKRVPPASR